MNVLIPGVISILLYIGIAIAQGVTLKKPVSIIRACVLGTGFLAIFLHGLAVYYDIVRPLGTNVSIFAMASLITWAIAVSVLLSSLKKPLDNLFIVLFPLAAFSISLSLLNPEPNLLRDDLSGFIFSHILMSILAYSFLTIAAFQALILLYVNNQLKNPGSIAILRALPPLQTLEALLFEMVWVGWTFLTLSIASGFIFMEDMFAQHLVHHTIITLAAWVVFAVLLWGRHMLGWRGAMAIKWTLAGFVLLLLGYFGTKLMLEVILERV
jgi:ABC-type uncharacterized transport system permease subunit